MATSEKRVKYPQYCPECNGEHGNPRFVRGIQIGIELMNAGSGEVEGYTCTNAFHEPRKRLEHHIWCNGHPSSPVEGCLWCDPKGDSKTGLWAKYPYDTAEEVEQLASKHFPDAKAIK